MEKLAIEIDDGMTPSFSLPPAPACTVSECRLHSKML